jgi:hypothetical protein
MAIFAHIINQTLPYTAKTQIWNIIMLNKALFVCPICGYPNLNEAPYDDNGCTSFNICPCCGTEFGYDDFTTPHSVLRKKWIIGGMKWWNKNLLPPNNWNPKDQLNKLSIFSQLE